MVFSVAIYTLCWLVSYILANILYNETLKKLRVGKCINLNNNCPTRQKMPYWAIIMISFIFTLYNCYLTNSSTSMAGDRQNYLYEFEGGRDSPSLGLMLIQNVIINYGGDFNILLYTSSFIGVLLPLLAYRISKISHPLSLLLLFLSLYIYATYMNLKQCYTSALASFALVLIIQYKGKIIGLFCVFLIIISCIFHSTGFILIPLFFFLRFYKKELNIKRIIIFSLIFALLFLPTMKLMSSIFSGIMPLLSAKIDEYFMEDSVHAENSSIITIFKGFNIYYITYQGIKWRSKLKGVINHFDKYLFLTIACSFLYLMAAYSYWMQRFIYIFIFVVFQFFAEYVRYIPYKKEAVSIVVLSTFLVTYRELILIYTLYGGI